MFCSLIMIWKHHFPAIYILYSYVNFFRKKQFACSWQELTRTDFPCFVERFQGLYAEIQIWKRQSPSIFFEKYLFNWLHAFTNWLRWIINLSFSSLCFSHVTWPMSLHMGLKIDHLQSSTTRILPIPVRLFESAI